MIHCTICRGDVVVIVNNNVGITTARKIDIVKIFTGRGTQLNDINFKPILQRSGSSHEEFLNQYISRTSIQLSNAWKKLVFTGKASMPATVENDADVTAAIIEDQKCVGYVERSSVTDNPNITILDLK